MRKKIKSLYIVQNYSKILPYVKPYKVRALIAILITIPVGSMDAFIAWALKPYTDIMLLEKGQDAVSTAFIPALIIVFSSLQSLLNYTATYLNAWVGQRISQDVKIDLFDKLLHYNAGFYDKQNSGDILFRFNHDVDLACAGLISNMKLFTTRLFSSLALIFVLFYNSWQLAILAVFFLVCALYPLTTIRKKIKGIMDKTVFSGAAVMTHYNETFSGNRIISSYNLYDYQNERFQVTLKSVFKLGMKMIQRTGMMSPLMHFIISLGIAGVIWMGSYLIATGEITPGSFVSFIAALLMLYTPIKGIGNSFNAVQMSLMAMERVFELLEQTPNIVSKEGAVALKSVGKGIEYKNVSFEYVTDRSVLKNVNLKIQAGETIAFVGNSGGGKTTMASILPRFYDVTDGSITIDGYDIRDLELDSLRDKIAIVFQDNFLFSGTIRENIMLANKNASKDELDLAIRSAYLQDFIATLDQGLDTQIGERGVLLSGGQKQRVAIARAFLKDAPIVILDEATSALDNKSEAIVQQAIGNLMNNRTVLIIAHRLSTVRNADKIVVVNNGEIAEVGSHQELLAKENSIYSSLYRTQLN